LERELRVDVEKFAHRATHGTQGTREIRWYLASGQGYSRGLMRRAANMEYPWHHHLEMSQIRVIDKMLEVRRVPLIPP